MTPWFLLLPLLLALVVLALAYAALHRRFRRAQRLLNRRHLSQAECYDTLHRLGFHGLHEYRRSDLWRAAEERYRNSDYPQRCLICGSRDFDLHHRSYARLGQEALFDLIPLCRTHHDQVHELLDPNPDLCVKDTHDLLPALMDGQQRPEIPSEAPPPKPHVPAALAPAGPAPAMPLKTKQPPKRAGTNWSPKEDAALLKGFANGMTMEQLADRHQRRLAGILGRLYRLGQRGGRPARRRGQG